MAGRVDALIVVGSQNSSNSQRLCEVSTVAGTPAYLVNDETEIKSEWLKDAVVVGVTAGASAPEELVIRVLEHLRAMGALNSKSRWAKTKTFTSRFHKNCFTRKSLWFKKQKHCDGNALAFYSILLCFKCYAPRP